MNLIRSYNLVKSEWKQEGQPGSKTITTPITVNPLTGEKVGEGQPTEEITKQPVDKIVEFGGEKPKDPKGPENPEKPSRPTHPSGSSKS